MVQITVTADNRKEYVELYCDWLLSRSVRAQFRAFSQGFHNVRPRQLWSGSYQDACHKAQLYSSPTAGCGASGLTMADCKHGGTLSCAVGRVVQLTDPWPDCGRGCLQLSQANIWSCH